MSQISAIVPLLGDASANRREILARMGRLDENFECSAAEAMALWNRARRCDLGALGLETFDVAILSNTTQDFLLPHLYAAGFACSLDLRCFWPGAGRIADLAMASDSALYVARPRVVFVSYDQEQALGGVLYKTLDRQERLRAAGELVDEIHLVVDQLTSNLPAARIVLHTFHWFHPPLLGFVDSVREDGPGDVTEFLNQQLRSLARTRANVHLLDMQRVVGSLGFHAWRNTNRWFGEGVDTVAGNSVLAREYLRFVKAFTKRNRKVLVVDLDNTLWGGLAGEEGIAGVKLGGSYPGNAYQQFQRVLRLYSERGVLLAVNSKNNPEDALAILANHPAMVLRPDNFVAMQINWNDKTANMASIAQQLDLGLNSFVFIDDSPQERDLIRQTLPEVLVPEFPAQVADLPYLLDRLNDFDYESYTETDRQRTQMYRTQSLRREMKESAASLDEYLAMLGTRMKIWRAREADLGRLEQMFQRTNQFNTTARRYTLGELAGFTGSPDCALLLGSVEDKFGDHGIVVAVLLRFGETAVLDSFLMSCRVIGRGVESAMLAHVTDIAAERGYDVLHAEFVPTRKNEPSRGVYVQHGFLSHGSTGATELFALSGLTANRLRVPAHITLLESEDE